MHIIGPWHAIASKTDYAIDCFRSQIDGFPLKGDLERDQILVTATSGD